MRVSCRFLLVTRVTVECKFSFFSPSGFEIQSVFGYRTSKIKFYSVRALKCYLNEKNLINSRVTATISKFSSQIFETYFNTKGAKPNIPIFSLFFGRVLPVFW